MKYAASLPDSLPSYWSRDTDSWTFVDVDEKTFQAVEAMALGAWDGELVGKGDDGRDLHHRGIKVLAVQRIENSAVFRKYNAFRKTLLNRMDKVATRLDEISGSRGSVSTDKYLAKFMRDEMYSEINESYLFHGTKVKYVSSIAGNGFNLSYASLGRFGKGIYMAERSTKADQYTDSNLPGSNLTEKMLLVRGMLGNIYLCQSEQSRLGIRNSSKPPTTDDHNVPAVFDSVVSDLSDPMLGVFREFVVYREEQTYPEYVIEYTRLSSAHLMTSSPVLITALVYIWFLARQP
ncbi:protein mono-ADP-ribosyltransferase PARP14-like [Physella acuta]|uniref:protein mono-ADP-ribosyltransferase PARP14-like n=1 Tax=Physella acuta TaxID=109671 RepID=UPI0027DD11B8|nr:protein mono-ADP-ribosyltransferase PARP14-like [Physella acuta]